MHGVQPECKPTFAEVSKSIYFARIWCMESSRNAGPHLRRFQNRFILPKYDAWSLAGMQTHICGGFKIDLFCPNMMHGVRPECKPTFGEVVKTHLFWLRTMHGARPDCKPTSGRVWCIELGLIFLLVGGWSRKIAMPESVRHGKFPLSDFCIYVFLPQGSCAPPFQNHNFPSAGLLSWLILPQIF